MAQFLRQTAHSRWGHSHSPPHRVSLIALLLVLVLGVILASAQTTTPVCPDPPDDPPASGERIACTEDATSTTDIDIDAEGVDIDTTADNEHGIGAMHQGDADIDVTVGVKISQEYEVTTSDIDTTGASAHGIFGKHTGTGDVDINATLGEITTTGSGSHGISVEHTGTGDVDIDTTRPIIRAEGQAARGINADHTGTGDIMIKSENGVDLETSGNAIDAYHHGQSTGNIIIKATGLSGGANTINTSGQSSRGIRALNYSKGSTDITATDVNITTTATGGNVSGARGIEGVQSLAFLNSGPSTDVTYNVNINVSGSRISTMGDWATGIYGLHQGKSNVPQYRISNGNLEITATNTDITTGGKFATGIDAKSEYSQGDVMINMTGGSIKTAGSSALGIRANHGSNDTMGESGDIRITVKDAAVETTYDHTGFAPNNYGVSAANDVNGAGHTTVTLQNTTITTEGHGVIATRDQGPGDIRISAVDGRIVTKGAGAFGINAENYRFTSNGIFGSIDDAVGDITIDTRNLEIETQSTELVTSGMYTLSPGIYALHRGMGDIDIDAQGGSVMTKGVFSYGIYGIHRGEGDITIETRDGHTITTTGENGHGIVAYHFGTEDTRSMAITVGGSVETTGEGSQGVRVGVVRSTDHDMDPNTPDINVVQRVAARDDGYRKQTVTVNGSVMSEAAGVFLAGGGKVFIGPQGTIRAASGIAILATGDTPVAGGDPPLKPTLYVDINLDGRPVAQVIYDDWIINDGGETTILVNDVKLHDGKDGVVPGAVAMNGAFDVTMREEGVTVMDRMDPDPANWVVSDPAVGVVADRDFSGEDFTEAAATCPSGQVGTPPNCTTPPPPPPPMCPPGQVGTPPNCTTPPPPPSPMCPPGQVGTPPNCTTPPLGCPDGQVGMPPNCTEPEPEQPMFREEYAPRTAVYEALPDFLLRLTGPGAGRKCRPAPATPVWVRFAAGQGTYEAAAEQSTTGATYNLKRFEAEGGLRASFNKKVTGWVSVRHVRGTADVDSPTGGGEIDVRGLGSSVGGAWQSATGVYAVGCFSYMAYNVDFASHQRGLLKAGADGRTYTLDVEAGRRFALGKQWQLTPRVWVTGSRVSVDQFTDAVNTRVSFADADRILTGLGVVAATTRPWGEGELALRGSVDFERIVKGAKTGAQISGEPLSAVATENSLLFGLNAVYRQGRFTVGAELAARQEVGSTDSEYAGFLNLGMRF